MQHGKESIFHVFASTKILFLDSVLEHVCGVLKWTKSILKILVLIGILK